MVVIMAISTNQKFILTTILSEIDLKRASQLPGSDWESLEDVHLVLLPNDVGHHPYQSKGSHPPLTSYFPGCAANV